MQSVASITCASRTSVLSSTKKFNTCSQNTRPSRIHRRIQAIQEPLDDSPAENGGLSATLSNARRSVDVLLGRYDFVSAGLGALAVTTFCVARGQDPGTALSITAASTVLALLVNDTMFNDS